MDIFVMLLVSFCVSFALVPMIRALARRYHVIDQPSLPRKMNARSTPLLGGVAIFGAVLIALGVAFVLGWLPGDFIKEKHLFGIIVATFLLVLGGTLDDIYTLKPWQQIVWPIAATLVIVASGIGIRSITNPLGGLVNLQIFSFTVLTIKGIPYRLTLLADLFTVLWLLSMTYTTKLLDGVDGLVSGITVIGAVLIAVVSLRPEVRQFDTAMLAMIVAGAFFGFLLYNFFPASIFLGDAGSTLAGFLLGVLAIIAGGKIATTLLILGLPLFDATIVVLRRMLRNRTSPFVGDLSHLHFRLLQRGWSQRKVAIFFYVIAGLFGISTLILPGWEKAVAIVAVLVLLLLLLRYAPDTRSQRTS